MVERVIKFIVQGACLCVWLGGIIAIIRSYNGLRYEQPFHNGVTIGLGNHRSGNLDSPT